MKLIVTGALGHIGSAFIRSVDTSTELILIDDMSANRYCSLFNLPNRNVQFIESKVSDINFDNYLKDVDFVIHLAALTDAAGSSGNPELVYSNNLDSTKHIANACLKHGVPVLFPSSTSVYGSQSTLVDETCKELLPQSPYADSKIKEEQYLLNLFQEGLKGIIFRFGTIHGKSEGMRFHTAVNKFTWQALTHQPLTVWETAMDQKRPYLAIEDAVAAINFAIKNKITNGELYNIVTENLTVRQIVDELTKYRPNLTVKLVQHKIMNQLSYEVSSKKILELGFRYEGSYQKSIADTIELFKGLTS